MWTTGPRWNLLRPVPVTNFFQRVRGGPQHRHRRLSGFHPDFGPSENADKPPPPRPDYGLSMRHMQALGLTDTEIGSTIDPFLLTARAHYGGEVLNSVEAARVPVLFPRRRRRRGRGVRGSPQAPDLPSMLLQGRIVYLGMPIVPSVSELIVAQMMYLAYSDRERPMTIYINSWGSQDAQLNPIAQDTDATAILDTMMFLRNEIWTLVLGQARGSAATILASGRQGRRFATPHSRIMTAPPRIHRVFGRTMRIMDEANELQASTDAHLDCLESATGKDRKVLSRDLSRHRYFTPQEAIEYGLIDKIIYPRGRAAEYEERRRQQPMREPFDIQAAEERAELAYQMQREAARQKAREAEQQKS